MSDHQPIVHDINKDKQADPTVTSVHSIAQVHFILVIARVFSRLG